VKLQEYKEGHWYRVQQGNAQIPMYLVGWHSAYEAIMKPRGGSNYFGTERTIRRSLIIEQLIETTKGGKRVFATAPNPEYTERLSVNHEKVLKTLAESGDQPDFKIEATITAYKKPSTRAARVDLYAKGFIHQEGETKTPSGLTVAIWQISDKGLEYMRRFCK